MVVEGRTDSGGREAVNTLKKGYFAVPLADARMVGIARVNGRLEKYCQAERHQGKRIPASWLVTVKLPDEYAKDSNMADDSPFIIFEACQECWHLLNETGE